MKSESIQWSVRVLFDRERQDGMTGVDVGARPEDGCPESGQLTPDHGVR